MQSQFYCKGSWIFTGHTSHSHTNESLFFIVFRQNNKLLDEKEWWIFPTVFDLDFDWFVYRIGKNVAFYGWKKELGIAKNSWLRSQIGLKVESQINYRRTGIGFLGLFSRSREILFSKCTYLLFMYYLISIKSFKNDRKSSIGRSYLFQISFIEIRCRILVKE